MAGLPPPARAVLGDPKRGGDESQFNATALRALFFSPVRFDELARHAPGQKKYPGQRPGHHCIAIAESWRQHSNLFKVNLEEILVFIDKYRRDM